MRRMSAEAAAIVLILTGAPALAQGVAPGGPIGNSTAIGSGLGGVTGGTGPSYPNGTTAPTLPPPPPPGGGALPSTAPPAISTTQPSYYPQPNAPFGATLPRQPSTVPMSLPQAPAADVSFLKGCWRTDVFQYEQQNGLTTWCFNDRGLGRVLYTRLDHPGFNCHAPAEARYAAGQLRFHSLTATCSDSRALILGDLDCAQGAGGTVQCRGTVPTQTWTVGLYRVR